MRCGTAQVASNEFIKKGGKPPKDNAWFVGFLPREHPEIVVAALYEGGMESKFSAALVRDVLKAYMDKKAREGKSLVATKATPRGGDAEMGRGGDKTVAPAALSPQSPPQPGSTTEAVIRSSQARPNNTLRMTASTSRQHVTRM